MSWPESPPRTAPQRQRPGAAGIRRPGGRFLLRCCLAATLQQEKQRSGLMAMTLEQRSLYITQQMSRFEAIQEQVTPKCSQTKASPPSSQCSMSPRTRLLQDNPNPRMIPPARHQSPKGMGMIEPTPGRQQGGFDSDPQFPIPSHSAQTPLGGLGSICQNAQSSGDTASGMPLPRFCPSPLGSQPSSPHQLREPSVPRIPTTFSNAAWMAVAAAATMVVSREAAPSTVDNSMQQHLDGSPTFAEAPVSVPPAAGAVTPPSHMALGGRPGQKGGATLASPSFSQLGSPSPRQSPLLGPVPVLSTAKFLQQGLANFNPRSPIQGTEPPSSVAAAAAAAATSIIASSQSPGPVGRTSTPPELPPNDFVSLPQPPLKDLISPPDCSEVGLIEALLRGPSVRPYEDWVCNLRLIDDILEQQAAAQNILTQSADHLTQDARELLAQDAQEL